MNAACDSFVHIVVDSGAKVMLGDNASANVA
jgi:hypothetical protein